MSFSSALGWLLLLKGTFFFFVQSTVSIEIASGLTRRSLLVRPDVENPTSQTRHQSCLTAKRTRDNQIKPRVLNHLKRTHQQKASIANLRLRLLFPPRLRMDSLESKSLSGQGQTCAGINGTILRQPPLPDTSRSESVSENPAAAEMKGRRLKMRRDV